MLVLHRTSTSMVITRVACVCAALLLAGSDAVARTWRITPFGTGDAPTVQAGIDSARGGDVVLLAAGTYAWTSQGASGTAMLRLVPGITLRGESGAAATILDGESLGRIAECDNIGTRVVLEDLTFQHGLAPRERPLAAGTSTQHAGAVAFTPSPAGIEAPADSHGGAIDVRGISEPTIRRCVFTGNMATGGTARGGAVCWERATLEGCEFTDNQAGVSGVTNGSGGAVWCASATIHLCTFRRNRAWGYEAASGGALRSASADIADCSFDDNHAECPGAPAGGAIMDPGWPAITRCVFRANGVAAHYFFATGGALDVGVASVTDCLLMNNSATCLMGSGRGGALAGRELTVARCAFVGNSAARIEPAGAGSGGAIYALFASTIENCTLVANAGGTADGVGGIYFEEEGTLRLLLVTGTAPGRLGSGNGSWSCCVFFGNAAGNRPDGIDAGDNFSADPYFCADPGLAGDVSVRSTSPCTAANRPWSPGCGLIGASAVQCEGQAIAPRSWSAVKQMYGRGGGSIDDSRPGGTLVPSPSGAR
jgi:hypothetical protein